MKKTVAWTLLALYLNASVQIMLPGLRDGVAHLLFWQEHLEHVHQGQTHSHHVHTEMAQLSADEQDDSAPLASTFSLVKDALSSHLMPDSMLLSAVDIANGSLSWGVWSFVFPHFFGKVPSPPP